MEQKTTNESSRNGLCGVADAQVIQTPTSQAILPSAGVVGSMGP
jgi:hypothetical protein